MLRLRNSDHNQSIHIPIITVCDIKQNKLILFNCLVYHMMILDMCRAEHVVMRYMRFMSIKSIFICLFILILAACQPEQEKRFELLDPTRTGITFVNELVPTPELNIFNYLYFYDGAGVAAGDLNGDGLPDLYFTSNQGQNVLYLNKGDFNFEDVTDRAFSDPKNFWSTGVTMADVNNNGRLDIYVSNVGGYMHFEGHNQLFINTGNDADGIPVFKEKAAEFGIDFVGLSTQAAFFDYNLDGLLDVYILNHSVHEFGTFNYSTIREEYHPLAGDRLYRNDGGRFTDVTEEAGIYNSALGYGLGIAIGDITMNGFPDIYIGNDFHEDDYLYINNGDGTFTESLEDMIQHTSYSSMGNDMVDFNNDGLPDIISLDMLPENYEMRQTAAGEDPRDIYNMKRTYGYKHKFSRNTLQLNRGNGKFSEVGMLAGIHATDWSWAALGADFNNNGYADIFITNGIQGRTNDLDYIHFISADEIQYRLRGNLTEDDLLLAERAPSVRVPNYMFMNNGTLYFEDVSKEWGINQPTYSSGAVYADLNNDGDLDLVVNNVNGPASVYRNLSRENFPASNYLKIRFKGPDGNRFGIGSKVTVMQPDDKILMRELYLSRGFQSSVEPVIHLGLDTLEVIAEIHIKWPDGRFQKLQNIRANQTLVVDYQNSDDQIVLPSESSHFTLFEDITDKVGLSWKHEENSYIEFNREALIPHMVSREGPALVAGDVNGNGLDDLFLGGARRQKSSLFVQVREGVFQELTVPDFEKDAEYEDVDALLADFTGNGFPDLFVVSGGNEYSGDSEFMQPRLYINDGRGNFTRDKTRLPDIYLTGSAAATADVNGDGLPDIFIGARTVPWNYGIRPVSYLLMNTGDGYFKTDTTEYGRRFADLGMVTGAEWGDMNNDGRPDLVVASEWEGLKIIYNNREKGSLDLPNSSGIWNTLKLADLANNGNLDILAGNLGLNSSYSASEKAPLRMYVNDFDGNGSIEQIITYMDRDGSERLFARKDELAEQMPFINERFETYADFAGAHLYEVIEKARLEEAVTYSVTDLTSSVFYNQGNRYVREPLPDECQFSPLRDFLVTDLTRNGLPDVVGVGNFFDAATQRGRYDASYGDVLINEGSGLLSHLPNREINWYVKGQFTGVETLRIDGSLVMVVAENNGTLRFFKIHDIPSVATR
jgi:enediyne biosynthesis protein E4